jgi:hypothetical protein
MPQAGPRDEPEPSTRYACRQTSLRALGVAVLVAVFAGSGGYASAQAFSDGFGPAMAAGAALSLAGAIAGLALRGRRTPVDIAPPQVIAAAEAGGEGS